MPGGRHRGRSGPGASLIDALGGAGRFLAGHAETLAVIGVAYAAGAVTALCLPLR
ncbi:hypothetical protein RM780_16835 [Streptomyces sp. DSM 44917]|uniref:Uncharacterized protein n=1 Tax=Streptomyces boetiae TaxID=3075541 RepID=A0ABU2LAL6_9ACTN|nr:hypothetical protein [Streptomyces sp. DSM 44917]MDT0308612.1 hypothetical protein [Streptomyces sp. DSM 44917]